MSKEKNIKVKFKRDYVYTLDGVKQPDATCDQEVDLPQSIAKILCRKGICEFLDTRKTQK